MKWKIKEKTEQIEQNKKRQTQSGMNASCQMLLLFGVILITITDGLVVIMREQSCKHGGATNAW